MSHDNIVSIDDKTRISLFALAGAVPVLIAVCVWLGTLSSRVDANESSVRAAASELRDDRATFRAYVEAQILLSREMRDRLIRIETKLDNK